MIKRKNRPSLKLIKTKSAKRPISKKIKSSRPLHEVALRRAEENPLISPNHENEWEVWQTFNPGVILLENKVHFLYRAIGQDGISRFGYAASNDGFNLNKRLSYPVYEHSIGQRVFNIFSYASGGGWGGAEDPRIVRVNNEDWLYMTYTACDEGLRVALTSIKVKDFLANVWRWRTSVLISPPGKVHKNWVIFPEKIKGKYAILHSISPEISIAYVDRLEFDGKTYIQSSYSGKCRCELGCSWEGSVRGAGAPPIKTQKGWLLFYHALHERDPNKYKVGAMILDNNDPTKILYRSEKPFLEPNEWYENSGFKPGIVYITGAVVKDGTLLVYYGGADSYVNVAYANLEKFLEALIKKRKPKLRSGPFKKR